MVTDSAESTAYIPRKSTEHTPVPTPIGEEMNSPRLKPYDQVWIKKKKSQKKGSRRKKITRLRWTFYFSCYPPAACSLFVRTRTAAEHVIGFQWRYVNNARVADLVVVVDKKWDYPRGDVHTSWCRTRAAFRDDASSRLFDIWRSIISGQSVCIYGTIGLDSGARRLIHENLSYRGGTIDRVRQCLWIRLCITIFTCNVGFAMSNYILFFLNKK